MNPRERVKRPRLDRTRPVRSWSTLLGVSAPTDHPAAERGSQAQPGDVIARSVELGYRVVDDYIRQGRRAAERLGERSYGPEALTGDVQELGARMMRYASDFMGIWIQLMGVAMAGGPASRAAAPPPGPPPAAAETMGRDGRAAARDEAPSGKRAPEHIRVRIEVASLWPTEVWLDLRPEAAHVPVVVHALRAIDPEIPRLDEVSFANGPAADPPILRVRIPPSQPPGVYNGLLVDRETNRPVGTVSVRVSRE